MIKDKLKPLVFTGYITLLATGLAALVWFSLAHKITPASYHDPLQAVREVVLEVQGQAPQVATLPIKINHLASHTPVTLMAEITSNPGDSLLVKSVFAPMNILIDDTLIYTGGQAGTYPAYMNDPPTIITLVSLTDDKEGNLKLQIDYLSLSQRSILSLPVIYVGNEAALFAKQFRAEGFSLLFSLVLIFIGLIMLLVALTIVRQVPAGNSLLWLGLFSLAAGIWVLGECDLAAFILPYPTLLYNMAYIGLFSITIPLLYFGLIMLNPQNKIPFYFMLGVHLISLTTVITLQFTGMADFTKTLFWFHIITPLGFVTIALCLLWEHFRHRNPTAKRFGVPVVLLALSTILEVLNYWLHFTELLTVFFQVGVLAFVISLGVVSGYYVKESVQLATEKLRLEYEMATMEHMLELQKEQYNRLAENDVSIQAQRHDLRHQLAVLRELNMQKETAKLGAYIDTLVEKIPTDTEVRLCENYAVNAVAAYYLAVAQRENIEVLMQFAIPEKLDSAVESDLSIIVGNLLENAVDACKRMTTGRRFILLNSNLHYNTLTITVDNSFFGTIRQKEGVFLSSKRTGEGIGITSVAAVAQKYGGAARFTAQDGIFQAAVYVNLN